MPFLEDESTNSCVYFGGLTLPPAAILDLMTVANVFLIMAGLMTHSTFLFALSRARTVSRSSRWLVGVFFIVGELTCVFVTPIQTYNYIRAGSGQGCALRAAETMLILMILSFNSKLLSMISYERWVFAEFRNELGRSMRTSDAIIILSLSLLVSVLTSTAAITRGPILLIMSLFLIHSLCSCVLGAIFYAKARRYVMRALQEARVVKMERSFEVGLVELKWVVLRVYHVVLLPITLLLLIPVLALFADCVIAETSFVRKNSIAVIFRSATWTVFASMIILPTYYCWTTRKARRFISALFRDSEGFTFHSIRS